MGHGFLSLYGPDWEKFVERPLGDFVDEVYRKFYFYVFIMTLLVT